MKLGRVEVSGGALAVWALLYYLDGGETVGWVLLSCALHELGHLAAIYALGGRVARLRLTWVGAELRLSVAYPLSPGRLALCALAGPGANLLLAWGSAALARYGAGRLYFLAGLNLGLALFNLLPAGWLDGGRALEGTLASRGWEALGEKASTLCSDAVAALLLGAGLVLLWQSGGRNFTLLTAGLWMTAGARRERGRGAL